MKIVPLFLGLVCVLGCCGTPADTGDCAEVCVSDFSGRCKLKFGAEYSVPKQCDSAPPASDCQSLSDVSPDFEAMCMGETVTELYCCKE